MRDHQDAEPAAPQPVEQVEDARAHGHVEHRDGLVGDEQLGLEHERRRDRDALPLAARELVRVAVEEQLGRREPGALERLAHALGALRARADAMDHERLRDRVAHAVARVERLVGILEDDLRLAPHRPQLALRERGDVAPVDLDRARARHEHAHDRLRGRRLAAARLADERDELARRHRQRDAVDRAHHPLLAARERADEAARERVVHDEVAHGEQRGAGRSRRRSRCEVAGGEVVLADRQQRAGAARGRSRTSSRSAERTGTRRAGGRGAAARRGSTPRRPSRSGRASRRTACACTGCRGASWSSAVGPRSAMRPAYITAAVWHVCATIGRSCVISTIASPRSSRELDQELQDLRLHHHVERGRRLVGEQHARVARERHRDRRALAHAAGELVREAARALGADADELEQLAAARVGGPALRLLVQLHRLDDLVADALHRVERVHRALEHHRDVAPAVRAHARLAAREDVLAVQQDAARRCWRCAAAAP